jgi:hypothetical protein
LAPLELALAPTLTNTGTGLHHRLNTAVLTLVLTLAPTLAPTLVPTLATPTLAPTFGTQHCTNTGTNTGTTSAYIPGTRWWFWSGAAVARPGSTHRLPVSVSFDTQYW